MMPKFDLNDETVSNEVSGNIILQSYSSLEAMGISLKIYFNNQNLNKQITNGCNT